MHGSLCRAFGAGSLLCPWSQDEDSLPGPGLGQQPSQPSQLCGARCCVSSFTEPAFHSAAVLMACPAEWPLISSRSPVPILASRQLCAGPRSIPGRASLADGGDATRRGRSELRAGAAPPETQTRAWLLVPLALRPPALAEDTRCSLGHTPPAGGFSEESCLSSEEDC